MKKTAKILGLLALLGLGLLAGLAGFVRFYLTEARIKTLVLPPLEKALGREVTMGTISVSLFSGISLNDFAVKEAPAVGDSDFVSARAFVLRYDLLPLLRGKLSINEIRLEEPKISLRRAKDGSFNFASLAVLQEKTSPSPAPAPTSATAGLPMALTIDQVRIHQAHLTLEDAQGQLPAAEVTADLAVTLALGQTMTELRYQGEFQISCRLEQGELRPQLTLTGQFDQQRINYRLDLAVAGDQLQLAGEATNYLASPNIRLDISSPILRLDKLLALVPAGEPAPPKTPPPASPGRQTPPPEAPGAAIPANLVVHGRLNIEQLHYQEMNLTALTAAYRLENRIFTLADLQAALAGGRLLGKLRADLTDPALAYAGQLQLNEVQAGQLAAFFNRELADNLSGTMGFDLAFSGAGTQWPALADNLDGKGGFAIRNGRLRSTGLTRQIAGLVQLGELNDISFHELTGEVEIVKGRSTLRFNMLSTDLRATASGTVGRQGELDIPLTLALGPGLSAKLRARNPASGYLQDDQGQTALYLKIAGTVDSPAVSLNSKAVGRQAEKVIRQKAEEELGKLLEKELEKPDKPANQEQEAVKSLLKGLFNK